MELRERIRRLYDKDTKSAYANLRELESLSLREDVLYPYVDEFLAMLRSERYVVRVRGFRLLCKQAKWDKGNRLNASVEELLSALNDEKPTAVRQALKALEDVAPYKRELNGRIREAMLSINCAQYKDTMRPLIEKDIQSLVQLIDSL